MGQAGAALLARDYFCLVWSNVPEMRQNDARSSWRFLPPLLLGLSLMACPPAQAEQKFKTCDLFGRSSALMICDLDGDGLEDLVLMDDLNLSIFYQDRSQGFTREPQQSFRLEHRPSVVWAAKLGRQAASLLVLTSDGVSELSFTNRTGPPNLRQIIRQPTIVPEAADDTNAVHFPLSVTTGRDWPLLLVPATDGIQVWQHRDQWAQAQFIAHSVDASLEPIPAHPGYDASYGLDLSVGDVNGDGRDDLMVRRSNPGRANTYTLYLQQSNGLFALQPAFTYTNKEQFFSWLYWADLNHDGKVDLIKSVWLNEPSFLPGFPSAKVLICTYIADAHGSLPPDPQQVFRKNDYVAVLPVVDVDRDGFLDLVLGYIHVDDQESLGKAVTTRKLDYSLKFYFGRPGAAFPKEPDCQRDVLIHLDQAEPRLGWGIDRKVKLGGDFTGNGKTDLLVREHSDEISVYSFISREKGFSLKPDLRFHCPDQIEEWEVADLNNDGVSDLVVKLAKQNGFRIFLSQK